MNRNMNLHNSRRLAGVAIAGVALLVVLAVLVPSTVYVVDEREMAVVLQFGNPVAERTEPGVYIKTPFVQEVRKLPSTRQFWGDSANWALHDLPTRDDKKIELVPWAVWRVREPTVFVRTLRTMDNAEQRVGQFVRGAIRDVITQYDLAELVRNTDRELHTTAEPVLEEIEELVDEEVDLETMKVKTTIQHGRKKILDQIKDEAQRRLASAGSDRGGRGIELIDLGISQIDFVESVRRKTFDRWIAEREAISARNINEGERLKQEIINRAAAEVERLEGEGQQQSHELRGEVDAEIIRKYAEAIEEAGDFYTFVRTLETYRNAIGQDTKLIFTTDSDLFQLLKTVGPAELPPVSPPSPPAATTTEERPAAAGTEEEAAGNGGEIR